MVPNRAKKLTKRRKEKGIRLTRFDQNLLSSLDLAQLRQLVMNRVSKL